FATLHLDVVRSATDELIASAHLPLSLSGVKDMYRTANLRGMTNPGVLAEPPNNPDSSSNGKNLVFLHGYQPDSGESGDMTAWLSEMFKRFHQSGSAAKFHGVLWFSNQGDPMDYQKNVVNAFQTAPVLRDYVGGLNGEVVVVAHSLGNMVVSSAIADHNMAVSKYMMCDAAVASEAYDSTMAKTDDLVHPMWADHDRRTWAANWHELFSETLDSRRMLTWRNRLRPVVARTEVWSFFSTGDEVFDLSPGCSVLTGVMSWREYDGMYGIEVYPAIGNFGRYSWQKQELLKGARRSNGWNSFGGTTHAGWAFEASTCTETQIAPYTWRIEISPECANPATANALSPDQLRGYPAFKHKPDWLVGESTLSQGQIDEMLAMGIPALTPSAGRTQVNVFEDNDVPQFDLDNSSLGVLNFKPNGLPIAGHLDRDGGKWLHNDMSDTAYYFTFKLFDRIVLEGAIK
ncbi:MAG TPA: hypothetical protein PKJ41_13120, partial [Bryobacteraceae bacterium]|nr:hypothetical protein [Bryobacteraceae bacterium]